MPDAARYAAMSWPDENYHFRRGWAEPPPQKRERRPAAPPAEPAQTSESGSSDNTSSVPTVRAQRARALDRAADSELALGHHIIAERLSGLANLLRESAQ